MRYWSLLCVPSLLSPNFPSVAELVHLLYSVVKIMLDLLRDRHTSPTTDDFAQILPLCRWKSRLADTERGYQAGVFRIQYYNGSSLSSFLITTFRIPLNQIDGKRVWHDSIFSEQLGVHPLYSVLRIRLKWTEWSVDAYQCRTTWTVTLIDRCVSVPDDWNGGDCSRAKWDIL